MARALPALPSHQCRDGARRRSPTPRCARSRAWRRPRRSSGCSMSPWPGRRRTWSGSCGRWRRTDRVIAAQEADARHPSRHLTTWIDDDGMVVLRGRLTPEIGAVLHRALEAAADQLRRESKDAPETGPRRRSHLGPAPRRRVGAAGRGGAHRRPRCRATPGTATRSCCTWRPQRPRRRRDGANVPGDGVLEVDDAAIRVSAETSRRLACDAARRRDAPRRRRARPRRRPQDALHSHRDAPRAQRPRHTLSLPRLFREALRRSPHRPLDGRRADQSRQSGAAVPAASSRWSTKAALRSGCGPTAPLRSSTLTARSCASCHRSRASRSATRWRRPSRASPRRASSSRRARCPPGTARHSISATLSTCCT